MILVTAWLFVEQASIMGALLPIIALSTNLFATILCNKVVFPVPGGPFTAKIFSFDCK